MVTHTASLPVQAHVHPKPCWYPQACSVCANPGTTVSRCSHMGAGLCPPVCAVCSVLCTPRYPGCCGHPLTPEWGMRVVRGRFVFKAFVLPGLVGRTQLLSPGLRTTPSLSYPVQHCCSSSGSTHTITSLPIFVAGTYTGQSWHCFSVSFTT